MFYIIEKSFCGIVEGANVPGYWKGYCHGCIQFAFDKKIIDVLAICSNIFY